VTCARPAIGRHDPSGTIAREGQAAQYRFVNADINRPLPIARVGDSDGVRVGERVFAMGNPLGLSGSVTSGILSAVDRDVRGAPTTTSRPTRQ
jgi:S1-C subfamily serine protease